MPQMDWGLISPQYGTPMAADSSDYQSVLNQMHQLAVDPQTRSYDSLFDRPSWWTRAGQTMNALGAVAPYLQPQDEHPPIARTLAPQYRPFSRSQPWQAPQINMGPALTQRIASPYFRRGGMAYALHYGPGGATRQAEQYPTDHSPDLYRGPGGGQEDKLDAKVSPGEYIISAPDVSMLGEGNNEEGAKRLDHMREAMRRHLGKNIAQGGHPPKPKNPLRYMFGGER